MTYTGADENRHRERNADKSSKQKPGGQTPEQAKPNVRICQRKCDARKVPRYLLFSGIDDDRR
jgi:hypothetical protein